MSRMNPIQNAPIPGVEQSTTTQSVHDDELVAPQPPVTHPSGETAPPMETIGTLASLEAGFDAAMSSGDPSTMMAAIASHMRRNADTMMSGEQSANSVAQGVQLQKQIEAYHKAAQDQASAATWGLVAKIGAYVAAAVSVAVGVCGAMFSGGVSLLGGIALALVCVSAAASTAMMVARDTHAFGDQPPPRWMGIAVACIALVGTVCSFGANASGLVAAVGTGISVAAQTATIVTDVGVATHAWSEPPAWLRYTLAGASLAGAGVSAASAIGGASSGVSALATAARDTSQATVNAVNAVAQGARAAAQLTEAAGTAGSAIWTFEADDATAEAKSHKRAGEHLHDVGDDILDAMRHVQSTFQHAIERAAEMARDQNSRRTAITSNFARA